MAIDRASANETTAEGSALRINRTGIMVNPDLSAELIQGTKETTPTSEDSDEIRVERAEYVSEAPPIGSYPVVVDGERAAESEETETPAESMALLLDKLSERLAFERQGTRLYEAFIQKVESLPIVTGAGPDDISAIARNVRVPRFQSSKLGSETFPIRRPALSI